MRGLFLIAIAACILTALLPAARAPLIEGGTNLQASIVVQHPVYGPLNLGDDIIRAMYIYKDPAHDDQYYVAVRLDDGWSYSYYFNTATTDIRLRMVP